MVTVIFNRDSRKRLSSVFAAGHADWAQHGQDLVCAAVSAILQAARLGLEDHAKVRLSVTQQEGDLCLEIPEDRRDDEAVQAIMATAALSVEQIARQYPGHVAYESRTQT